MIRFCIADYLRDCGFQIVEAVDVEEAMTLLRSPDVPIDLVFSDVNMPGDQDRFDLARWLRAAFPDLPVILTSGAAQTADLGEELCALSPIETKPYQAQSLTKRIERVLAAKGAPVGSPILTISTVQTLRASLSKSSRPPSRA